MDFNKRTIRNNTIKIPYSQDEIKVIEQRANDLRLKLATYIRLISLKAKVIID